MTPKNEHCSLCRHLVYDLYTHLQTEDHKRALRREALGGLKPPSAHKLKVRKSVYGNRYGKGRR